MCKNSQGFTLIEFLVSIVILMVGMLGMLSAVNVALFHNFNTKLRDEAVVVADLQMSRELNKPFDLVSTSVKNDYESRKLLSKFVNYSVQRSGAALSNSKQVRVAVRWKYKGVNYNHETNSVISKK